MLPIGRYPEGYFSTGQPDISCNDNLLFHLSMLIKPKAAWGQSVLVLATFRLGLVESGASEAILKRRGHSISLTFSYRLYPRTTHIDSAQELHI